jgi:hypothetical protein
MQELMDRCVQVESTKSKSSSTNWKEIGLILSKVKRRSPTSIRWLCVKQTAVSKCRRCCHRRHRNRAQPAAIGSFRGRSRRPLKWADDAQGAPQKSNRCGRA